MAVKRILWEPDSNAYNVKIMIYAETVRPLGYIMIMSCYVSASQLLETRLIGSIDSVISHGDCLIMV
jgi:hypothetical protein